MDRRKDYYTLLGLTPDASMAAIKKAYGVDSKLIEGMGGVFDVHVDGKQIWSKHDTGRFPDDNEVLDKIKPLAPAAKK